MRGSLLITFDEAIKGRDGSYFTVEVNGNKRQYFFFDSSNLYSTYISVGDVVTITFTGYSAPTTISVSRKDFTTDDEGGDRGIKLTDVASSTTQSITFTATTRNDAYNFYYIIDGTNDQCFLNSIGFNNVVYDIELDSNNDIYVSGLFTSYSGVSANYIIKLKSNGAVDNSFVYGTGFNNQVYDVDINSTGKLFAVGAFGLYSGITANRIISLNTDGTKNTGFTYGTGFNNVALAAAIQNDDKIVVCGLFTTYNGSSAGRVTVLNSDGSQYSGFTSGTGFGTITNRYPEDVYIQSDGKYLIGGRFTAYSGATVTRGIVRLNTNGTLDTSFSGATTGVAGVTTPSVRKVLELSNGKIIIGGDFKTYNSVNANCIVMLNNDGSIYSGFTYGTGFTYSIATGVTIVDDIVELSNGKLVISGIFNQYNGTACSGIIRLNIDGSVDSTFGSGLYSDLLSPPRGQTLVLDPLEKIYIGGYFNSFNGTTVPDNIALINLNDNVFICDNPVITPTPTPTPTQTKTPTPTPSPATPTPTPTVTSSLSTPTPTPTITPTKSITPTPTPTITPTQSITPTQTITPTVTQTSTPTPTVTPTVTITSTPPSGLFELTGCGRSNTNEGGACSDATNNNRTFYSTCDLANFVAGCYVYEDSAGTIPVAYTYIYVGGLGNYDTDGTTGYVTGASANQC